ncbi:M1 family metallopeptidase [Paenibacillus daejeonensis]|uniref:M1 family metallopeptidase n=1 Tax=Paenibacillus daejeonensis TaxID=135193 RepID=UPI00037AF65F|nr:M1 family aminopeptidase [Paenibacillus daejeonensis]
MIPRHAKKIVFVVLLASLLTLSLQHGFGEAWQSQYTFAQPPSTLSEQSTAAPEGSAAPGATEPDYIQIPPPRVLSHRVVEYHMDVQLDEQTRQLKGKQTVTWTNPGKQPVTEMYWHLYPNAFASPETTFMQESGGKLREDKATEASTGSMELLSLKTEEGESLLPRLHYVQPDDGNSQDRTLAKLKLPDPVRPGQSITLTTEYIVHMPAVFARMGYAGNFVMAGQWFPKLAKYETSGTRGRVNEGWNAHQYHGNSEFYSDFGIYNVRIQVPADYKVAATGFPTKAAITDGKNKIYQFYADDVHDFAWAASPDFIYVEEPYSTDGVPGVRIKLYLDPRHAKLQDRYMHAAKSALAKYAEWFGEYPYSTLSIVVPPAGGSGAGGMEYPTLVTSFAADSDNPGYELERVVIHEIGHQYWYGMVASNEFEEAWLDEGFTSYAEDKVMESEYGIQPNLLVESSYMTDPAPLKQLSWAYRDHDHYAENVYIRAKLVLMDMEQRVGAQTMRKIIRTYFQKYKFKHPSTADFQRVVEQVTKQSWKDYFDQYIYGKLMADFAVESINIRSVKQDGRTLYESVILIRKRGGDVDSVPIHLQFQDGKSVEKLWDAQETHIQYKITHSSPLAWAAVDPDYSIVLDNQRINNYMKAELPGRTGTRWNLGIVKVLEGLLRSLGW